jgi:endonuclease YncB( thermonuclease family)
VRHWKPQRDNVRIGPWARPESYGARERSSWPAGATAGVVLVAAACVGVAVGLYQAAGPRHVVDPTLIEWNAVQGVPTRAADAEDVAWERRAREEESPSIAPDRARGSGMANAGARLAFGTCYAGGGTNCVVDGDTFYFNGEKVRIAGIDAPETHPPHCDTEARLGEAATAKLQALLNSGAVTMSSIDRDRDVYGRRLRNVAVDGADVGAAMVGAGVARDYGAGRKSWC